jgi:glutamyl-tRNA(Gln) amidotransferase subunit E
MSGRRSTRDAFDDEEGFDEDFNYGALGLKAGLEIHQQLNTKQKLFCNCPTVFRDVTESNYSFTRYLRATRSELGEIDRAALEEMKHVRKFTYLGYDTTCLAENDEAPPTPLNSEALEVALIIAKMFKMNVIPQVHTMRKIVIDGSGTGGFQRTALIAVDGQLSGGEIIETICLEEDACQRTPDDSVFSLDRLGIPLVEIATAPCIRTPEEAYLVAAEIGMCLRSTGRVKRGIGTIRQDVNVSITKGARVEMKGVQELALVSEVVRREVMRQVYLLEIRDELLDRGATVPEEEPVDVTDMFAGSSSKVLKKADAVLALRLRKFGGLVGREIQPGRRLGSEMSDYAKKCGVGGLFHTDELPAYGVTADEVSALFTRMNADPDDCIVLVADTKERCICAMKQISQRAAFALKGIPEETRKFVDGGSSAYMRPLPGAARMYPETDVLPVDISDEYVSSLPLPELLSDKAQRYRNEFGLDVQLSKKMADSVYSSLFEDLVRYVKPELVMRTLLGTLKEVERKGVNISRISDGYIRSLLLAVQEGTIAKEAIPELLEKGIDKQPGDFGLVVSVDADTLQKRAEEIVSERIAFVKERGLGSVAPLMGVIMKEMRGSVDGKCVNEAVSAAVKKALER